MSKTVERILLIFTVVSGVAVVADVALTTYEVPPALYGVMLAVISAIPLIAKIKGDHKNGDDDGR